MKDFLIIGHTNAVTYKEFFPIIKDGTVKIPVFNKRLKFDGGDIQIGWYTTLSVPYKNELKLTKVYSPEYYPHYNNYDAIEVSKVVNIPMDYDGVMGVPITFLHKYNPNQFEIVGCADANVIPNGWKGATKEFVDLYYAQGNTGSYKEGNRLANLIDKDGYAKVPYKRILIRHKRKDDGE